jgi:putative colanic acid biosynthesis glycosyltransferase
MGPVSSTGLHYKKAKHHCCIKNGMVTHHQAMVYRTKILKNLRYDERYSLAADYKLTLQFISLTHSIHYINKALCVFEMGGVSQINAKESRRQEIQIRRELGISAPFTPYRQWAAQIVKLYMPWLYYKIRN